MRRILLKSLVPVKKKEMKSIVLLKFIVLFSLNAVLGQSNGQLLLQGDKLKGKCLNKYYTGFVIELDSTYTKIDSTTLFSQFPRIGSINFKNKVIVPTEFTITERV